MFDEHMKATTLTQDNETWQPLSLATRRLLGQLTEKQDEHDSEKRNPGAEDGEKLHDEARFLEQRLRDFERFEALVRGAIAPRRKRNY